MCELVCSSGSVLWLVTFNHPLPEGPPEFRQPATLFEAAVETAQCAASAVREEYFVFHPIPPGASYVSLRPAIEAEVGNERKQQARLVRCVFANPFRPVSSDPAWLLWNGGTAPKLAQGIYDDRAFDRLPVLADALEDAGCTRAEVLGHLRDPGPQVRGCWVLDLLLGKS
jgi:hypothetical protein